MFKDAFQKNRERLSREMAAKHLPNGGHKSVANFDLASVAEGRVLIETRQVNPDGSKADWTKVHEDHNLVVTQAENLLAKMAAGTANAAINYIELGDPAVPNPPQLSDTNLQQTTGERKATVAAVSGSQVEFTATWGVGDGNGFTFTEAGLFTGPFALGTMFARKSGFSIPKTLAFELRFTWTLRFDVSAGGGGGCSGIAVLGPSTVSDDFVFNAVGGEAVLVVPFDFTVGAKHLDVFLNGQRLVYTVHYTETNFGPNKGITFVAFTLSAGDQIYVIQRRAV